MFAIGWLIIITCTSSMVQLIIGRVVTGLGVGFISIAAPTYIGEAATADVRGSLGAGFQLCGTFWSFLSFLTRLFFFIFEKRFAKNFSIIQFDFFPAKSRKSLTKR